MAWPPTLPAGGRSNDTPQRDQHPADHNLIADALAEITARINDLGHRVILRESFTELAQPAGATVVGALTQPTTVAGRIHVITAQVNNVWAPAGGFAFIALERNGAEVSRVKIGSAATPTEFAGALLYWVHRSEDAQATYRLVTITDPGVAGCFFRGVQWTVELAAW